MKYEYANWHFLSRDITFKLRANGHFLTFFCIDNSSSRNKTAASSPHTHHSTKRGSECWGHRASRRPARPATTGRHIRVCGQWIRQWTGLSPVPGPVLLDPVRDSTRAHCLPGRAPLPQRVSENAWRELCSESHRAPGATETPRVPRSRAWSAALKQFVVWCWPHEV